MKRALFSIVAVAAMAAAGANYSFTGTTDKNPLEYAIGDTMAFTVTMVDKDASNASVSDLAGKNIELRWTLAGDRASWTATPR